MVNAETAFLRWGPVAAWMALIFLASATPSVDIPSFGAFDYAIKKAGHVLSYAILALMWRRGLGWSRRRSGAALMLSIGYALLDEFHQSFVPGRHPSLADALVFDAAGAALALWISTRLSARSIASR